MMDGSQERVRVWWQIYASRSWLELQHGPNEGWVLVGETIVFLAGPCACLDVVDAANTRVPLCFQCL